AYREARQFLGRQPDACQGFMVRDARYKFIAWDGYADQLFDLRDDPSEFDDRGTDPALAGVRERMRDRLLDWFATRKHRASETLEQVEARTHAHERMMGIQIGRW
ncbi:MAG: phosphonate monoester hydrolase, partial [Rhodoferax sp.]|nr:phosphonate monoester hydrolase [Rhodoferax sp.]MCB2030975.1 phosphonate monoester hydrolase [Rhodoferax sp.]